MKIINARWGLCTRIAVLCFFAISCAAQQKQVPDRETPPTPAEQNKPQSTSPFQSGAQFVQLLQRKSLVFPDLAMTTGALSAGQKFKLAANSSISLGTVAMASVSAGWNQAFNTPAGYGQGGEGYAKRFGSVMARSASNQFLGTFVLSSALHQDPRFFVEERLTFGKSTKYAIERVFVTRSDRGDTQVNWSGLLGRLGAEALANTYYPDSSRTAGETFTRYGYGLLWNAAGNLARQYWPTINKRLLVRPHAAPPEDK